MGRTVPGEPSAGPSPVAGRCDRPPKVLSGKPTLPRATLSCLGAAGSSRASLAARKLNWVTRLLDRPTAVSQQHRLDLWRCLLPQTRSCRYHAVSTHPK